MSEERLTLTGEKLIRDAFYSIPDFTDAEGNHISGVYGALYKLTATLKKGDFREVEISFEPSIVDGDKNNTADAAQSAGALEHFTPAVTWQIEKFREILGEKTILKSEDLSFLEESLTRFAHGGSFEAPPVISITAEATSDLNEVEEVFKKAQSYGAETPTNFIGYYLLTDNPAGSKKGKVLGISLCFEDEKAYYIQVMNFITEDYLGRKLAELSATCSLATFDIKESYRVFTPEEIAKRITGTELDDHSYETNARCFDILIGAYLANPIKNDYSPSDISTEYLGLPLEKRADVFGKASLIEAEEKKVADYACKVAYV